jgi:hypothetical protein
MGVTPARGEEPHHDESKVPAYTLPDPLVMQDGRKVTDAKMWEEARRPEILELFRVHMYGRSAGRPAKTRYEATAVDREAVKGRATRKVVVARFGDAKDAPKLPITMYLPNGASGPVPVFVGVHLFSTAAPYPMPGVPTSRPGVAGERLPEVILQRGYGFASINVDDLAPDNAENFMKGVIGYYGDSAKGKRRADEWGAIAAWAWGLSRVMDYFETDPAVDSRRVIAIGHSRMGKTALWAGAEDERFAMVISNDSGCGGAALSRRRYGETVAGVNKAFPYWFCENFKQYDGREDALPVDQHMLIALIAPRPVYVASAEEDWWADPRGEFLAARGADPVYRLLGTDGIAAREMPGLECPVQSTIGYHIRRGRHDLTDYDWQCYLAFADRHLTRR